MHNEAIKTPNPTDRTQNLTGMLSSEFSMLTCVPGMVNGKSEKPGGSAGVYWHAV